MALGLALLLSIPTLTMAQDESDLQQQVDELSKTVEQQQAAIKEMQGYLDKNQTEAAALLKALEKAEKEGFYYPAPHVDAKKALVAGMKSYARVAAGKKLAKKE
jgi:peptidoglycan hydrolase CwlO-like protein